MNQKTVNIRPSARVLRMLGKIDFAPWQCLAELIDNSIDAFIDQEKEHFVVDAPRVTVSLPTAVDLKAGTGILVVEDNGCGMSLDDMAMSVKAGYSGNDPVEKMGLFGMGFNISTARLGKRTEIWTTEAEANQWVGIVIDFEELEKAQDFEAPVVTKMKTEVELDNKVHGTRVEISRLEREITKPLIWGQGKAKTKIRLGKIYGRIMHALGITIVYDGDGVKAHKHCVWDKDRKVPTEVFGEVPAIVEIDEELDARKYCSTCWVWLTENEVACTACGYADNVVERKRRVKGWLGIQRYFDKSHYGIDLLRNGRVIEELDKSLFTFKAEDGDEIFEYPIDAIHWGGRIVGELEIDFVRVSHQKDSFDKLDPEWKRVTQIVRGNSPMQPQIAKRLNLPRNDSPLARLFTGYRKGKAGLKNLVPGDESGKGLNSGIIQQYRERFEDGVADYQNDEKWYALVLQVERANTGGTSGSQAFAGGLPISGPSGGSGSEDAPHGEDISDDTADDATTDQPAATPPEVDNALSGTYDLADLPGRPAITVQALKYPRDAFDTPYRVEPSANKLKFEYQPKADFFEEGLETPLDFLIIDLAYHFLVQSSESPRNKPVSLIAKEIRRRYFADSLTDVDSAADAAESMLKGLRRHYDERLTEAVPIELEWVDVDQVKKIESRGLQRDGLDKMAVEQAIIEGRFARYVDAGYLPTLVEKWPAISTDGKFFTTPYSSVAEELKCVALAKLVDALQDIRWLSEEASGVVNKDLSWRLLYARALASLRLVENWLV